MSGPIITTVPAGNLQPVADYLNSISQNFRDIARHGKILDIDFDTVAANGATNPKYAVRILHQPAGSSHSEVAVIFVYQKAIDAIATYARPVESKDGKYHASKLSEIADRRKLVVKNCVLSADTIPGLLQTKYTPLQKPERLTIAIKCCCEKGFFCDNITAAIDRGKDFTFWLRLAPKIRINAPVQVPAFFHLAVPMFGSILYSVKVKPSVIDNWSGESQRKFMAYGITEDETFFYDAPSGISKSDESLTIMRDTIVYLDQFYSRVMPSWVAMIGNIISGTTPLACKFKHHNYGIGKRAIDMLKSGGIDSDSTSAFILSMELYDICSLCYANANPVFSLVPDLS